MASRRDLRMVVLSEGQIEFVLTALNGVPFKGEASAAMLLEVTSALRRSESLSVRPDAPTTNTEEAPREER